MKKILFRGILAMFCLMLSIVVCQAATIKVPEDKPTIQEAINIASNGDTVLVNDGTYNENIDFLGKAITVKSVNGALVTKIVGDSQKHAVTFQSGEGINSVIDGFTITAGAPTWNADGVYCFASSPTIQNNTIRGNSNGIYSRDSSFPIIKNNSIIENNRRGVYSHFSSNPIIQYNIIAGNMDDGVYARDYATVIVKNNTITGNEGDGIGIGFLSTTFTVENNIITSNSGYGFGREWGVPQPNLSHNDVWGNKEGDYNGFIPGPGDISLDPLFEGAIINVPVDYPTIAEALERVGMFYLGQGSPCIGAGSDGKNMGAYLDQSSYFPPGDSEVHVAAGIYYESLKFPVRTNTKLIGAGADVTIIDAQEAAYVIQSIGGLNQNVVDGFTVRNGEQGIFCQNSSPVIKNNTIISNKYDGINCTDSSTTIQNNIISNNGESGIESLGTSSDSPNFPKVENNIITGNVDGIRCLFSDPMIKDNIIFGNERRGIYFAAYSSIDAIAQNNVVIGNGEEGIFCNNESSPKILNNTITGNGNNGVRCEFSSSADMENNIITSNRAYGIYVDASTVSVSFNDVWGNSQGNYYGVIPGVSDISEDPLFEGLTFNVPQDYPTITEALNRISKFYLGQGSPCIGADSNGKNMGAYPDQSSYIPPGDHEVYVAKATYYETLALPPFTKLIGGVGNKRPTIDAQGENSVIRSFGGSDQNLIEGFTLRNGKRGIHCAGSLATIKNNIITGNEAEGIRCDNAAPLIEKNTISGNISSGIYYCNDSYSAISTILSNTITSNGNGGILSWYASLVVQNNMIYDNTGSWCDDGIKTLYSSLLAQNNTIVGNKGISSSSGIECGYNTSTEIISNIVTSNEFAGIYTYNSNHTISYNDVWGNTHYDYYGDASPGVGDISANPKFYAPEYNDFHLINNSACIDTGSLDTTGLPDKDFEGQRRIVDGDGDGQARVDIGADEYTKNHVYDPPTAQHVHP